MDERNLSDPGRSDTVSSRIEKRRGALCAAGFAFLLLSYAWVTPPFRAPDEVNQFFRAYEISEGHFVARSLPGGLVGDWLPANLMKCARLVAAYPNTPPNAVAPDAVAAARALPLRPEVRDFAHFPNTAFYSPVTYLPATAGIGLGRIVGVGPLELLYLARMGDALAAAALLGYALARVPSEAAGVFLAIALLPMGLFQMGVVSPDALTFGLPLVWGAEWLRARQAAVPLSLGLTLRLGLIALVFSQIRPPYPVLLLLALAFPRPRFWREKSVPFFGLALVGMAFLGCLLWTSQVISFQGIVRADVTTDPWAQFLFVRRHPGDFLGVAVGDLWRYHMTYIRELVGTFGWASLPLPDFIIAAYLLVSGLMMASTGMTTFRFDFKLRLGLVLLAGAGLLSTQFFVYLVWNAVGGRRIEGFQGRYLIPFVLITTLALAGDFGGLATWRRLKPAAVGAAVLLNLAALAFIRTS